MTLKELVEKYLAVAGGYGKPVPLASLGLPREQAEIALSQLDEDYHISRFIHFHDESGESFQINGFPQTHVSIEDGIQAVL
jgi:hypothetical protein